MRLPRPKWYTAEELATCWCIDISMIHRYNQTGQLISEVMFNYLDGTCKCFMPEDYTEADLELLNLEEMIHVGKYYKLEEVERFEKEYGMSTSHAQEEYPSLLTDGGKDEPIYTLKKIGSYLNLSSDYLKHDWAKMNCPFNKSGKKLYAYPSQLRKWQAAQNKK